jgi:hypothetical protein
VAIDDVFKPYLQRLRSAVTATPDLDAGTRERLQTLRKHAGILSKREDMAEGSSLQCIEDILYGALSCPTILHHRSPAVDLSSSSTDVLAQLRIIQKSASPFAQTLAARRITHILRLGLQARSHHAMNTLLVIRGQAVFDWWLKADQQSFSMLLDALYEATRLWGWDLPTNATIWDAFRRWQWEALWSPAARLLVHR